MSLYGALFTGVSGLKAQGTAIGIVSDNIANMNTVGYKQGSVAFSTLVNSSSGGVAYNPGGVQAKNVQLVDKQGLLQSTDSATDIAISGNGFFVVGKAASSDSDIYFTRAGSFRTDNEGNFVNSAGFYLLGWPLDIDGRLPGAPGNINTTSSADLGSLEPVNVESSSGVAAATTRVDIAANLTSSEPLYAGAGATITFQSDVNQGLAADTVLAPTTFATPSTNNMVAGDELTVTTTEGITHTFEYNGFALSAVPANFTGLNITNETDVFTDPSTVGAATTADRTFTIAADGVTYTFTYKQSSPNPALGEFNSMSSLASAIEETSGLSARVVGSGATARIVFAPNDANKAMTFTNGGAVVDWSTFMQGVYTAPVGATNYFASLQGLANLVSDLDDLSATVESPLSDSSLTISSASPLEGIRFDDPNTAAAPNILTEMDLPLLDTAPTNAYLGPVYDAQKTQFYGTTTDPYQSMNMASGDIQPDFSRNVRVYDAQGTGHDLTVGFLKVGTNTWAVEVWAANPDEVSTSLVDSQLAFGTMTFNGDGTLRSVSSGLSNEFTVAWTNGSSPSSLTINWGTAGQPFGTEGATVFGLADGLSQFDAAYNVAFVNQNGAAVGSLVGVTIDDQGFVIANYSNGETKALFQLPLADFSNPGGLKAESGNVFSKTNKSGEINLRQPLTGNVGKIAAASLESSNVELAAELTNMIIAQRAYQANTKVISTASDLLDELNRL